MTTMTEVQKARLRALKVSKWCARVLVGGAFALSAVALWQLAVAAHIPWWLAWIWPVVIDGSIYQASTAVMALAGRDDDPALEARRYFQRVIGGGVLVSVAANGLHAWTSMGHALTWWQITLVAIVPPLLLLVGTHGVTILGGLDVLPPGADAVAGAEIEPEDQALAADPEPEVEQAPAVEPVLEHQAVPEVEPGQAPEPPAESAPDPEPETAGARIERAVGDALETAGRPHRQRDPEQARRAVELAGQGVQRKEIAEQLGISDRTVRRYLKAAQEAEQQAPEPAAEPTRPHLEVVVGA